MSSVNIKIEQPVVIARASVGEKRWGFWQFPEIERAENGDLHVFYHIANDSATEYGSPKGHSISKDGGLTWLEDKDFCAIGVKTKNGDMIFKHAPKAINISQIELPDAFTEFVSYGHQYFVYRKEDLPEQYGQWTVLRKKKDEAEFKVCNADVSVPGNTLISVEGVLAKNMFWRIRPMPDGNVCAIVYRNRILDDKLQKNSAQFLVSEDSGYSWRLAGDIPYEFEPDKDELGAKRAGFTEPDITFLPDGSAFCLLRTTDGNGPGPMYWSKSEDMLKTWSKPKYFDSLGVWPELITLKNGVTVASYGRPGLFLRATKDPEALVWDEPLQLIDPESYGFQKDTCSYTGMVALDDNSVLLTYSDFNYPDENNVKRKTVLVRKISFE